MNSGAWWISHLEFDPAIVRRLEHALGRPLSPVELDYLQDTIDVPAAWHRNLRLERVSAQAQRARLRALVSYPLHALAGAFWALDGYTAALVVGELARAGIALQRVDRDPAVIRWAAQAALEHWRPRGRGRPPMGGELYRSAWHLWVRLGGPDGSAAAKPGYATPIVEFACALLEGAGICLSRSTVAKHLQRAQTDATAAHHLLDTEAGKSARKMRSNTNDAAVARKE